MLKLIKTVKEYFRIKKSYKGNKFINSYIRGIDDK